MPTETRTCRSRKSCGSSRRRVAWIGTLCFRSCSFCKIASPGAPALPGLSVNFLDVDPGIARFDLMLELTDADERLGGWLEYSTDLFEAATMARMAEHLRTLLEAIVANPEERISRLPLLPAAERRQLLIDWNDTKTSFRRPGTFSERFARQVRARAARHGGVRSAGSAQLPRARASELGHRRPARREGVGPDVLVVLLAERGVDLLAGNDRGAAGRRSVSSPGPNISRRQAGPNHSSTAAHRWSWPGKAAPALRQGAVGTAGPRSARKS